MEKISSTNTSGLAEEYVSIIIPVYNESNKIIDTLQETYAFMLNNFLNFEIIVVDDGSNDNTVILVEEFIKQKCGIKLIKNVHKGKGHTVWTGMMASGGEYVCMCDADLATPIKELISFIGELKVSEDSIAIASRAINGSNRVGEPFYRNMIGRVYNLLVQVIVLPGIKDSQCGFKVFKGDVARDIFRSLKIYGNASKEISSAFFGAFDVEVLYVAKKKGYKYKEIPVRWIFVETSRLNFLYNSFFMLKDTLQIRINDWRGFYS